MKQKSILLCILGFCLFNCLVISIATAENETQSPEEIVRIQAASEEYDRKHPVPKTSPRPLKTFIETSTDGKSMSIGTVGAGTDIVVYKEKDNDTYHMGYCQYYAEKSNEDYSRPYWLSDIIIDGMRCSLCIYDEIYYPCREAIYRTEIEELSENELVKKVYEQEIAIKVLSILCMLCVIWIITLLTKNTIKQIIHKTIKYFRGGKNV